MITVVVAATLAYSLVVSAEPNYAITAIMVAFYSIVFIGNHYFPFDRFRPYLFFGLICATLALIGSVIYLTGNRDSHLGFLLFAVPIYAAVYYSYAGTLLAASLTSIALFIPYVGHGISSAEWLSLAISVFAYFLVGFIACYVVEGEKMYARESEEYKQLLEASRNRERDISLIYDLTRRFSYTLDLGTVLTTTVDLAQRTLPGEGSLLFLLEDSIPVLKAGIGILPFTDLTAIRLPVDRKWLSQLEAGNSFIAVKDRLDWLPVLSGARVLPHSLAGVPVFLGGRIIGYLICFTSSERGFREYHLDILFTIAGQAALAIDKARLYARTLADKTKLQTILETLRDGLLVTDSDGVIIQSNPVAERLLGPGRVTVGSDVRGIFSSAVIAYEIDGNNLDEAIGRALEGRTIFGELTLSSDPALTVQSQFIPLMDPIGSVTGIMIFLHDITELKRLDQMKSNFVSNVSHELRTPLTSIMGFVSLILAERAGPLTTAQQKHLEVVRQQTSNLADMIDDLLVLSQLQAQGGRIETEDVDMKEAINSSVAGLTDSACRKDIHIYVSIHDDLPEVRADGSRIQQVVTNIIGNAIKFTEPGGSVEINAHANPPFVQVQISDSGTGIPPRALPHVFERFYQVHPGDTEENEGFGLGLAICREIVEMHGGKIWAESDLGRGSTFYFTIPITRK